MLTTRNTILGLALLLAMIGNSAGQSIIEPPRQNPGGAQQQTNTEQRDTDQAPPSAIKILPPEQTQTTPTDDEQHGPQNRSDAWTLSDKIAVIASIVALLQFFALVATICVMMRTAKRQLRAYLLSKGGEISVRGMNRAVIVFINNGQTPAYDVRGYRNHAVVDFPLPENTVFKMTDIGGGSLHRYW